MRKFKSLLLKDSVKGKKHRNLFTKSYLFHNFALLIWIPKPVSAFKFAAKIVLYREVSQLVCDVDQLIGLFIGGITLSGLTFS